MTMKELHRLPVRCIGVFSVNWLGDVVFSTPFYRALKETWPGVRVVSVAVPRVKDVLLLCPDVDEVLVYDEEGEQASLLGKASIVGKLRTYHFDMVFFLRPSLSRTMLAWLAGIPRRVGLRNKNIGGLINFPVDDAGSECLHRSDVYLTLLEKSGLVVHDRVCRLNVPANIMAVADRLLDARGISIRDSFVVVNTGGNWSLKQWDWERFALLVRRLVQEKGMKVILTGAQSDVERVERVAELSGVSPVQLTGATDLPTLAAIFSRACCVFSSDSGPLHLASALGVRTVSIFGPTRPEITGPRGPGKADVLFRDVGCNKSPCYYLECPDNRCMKSLGVEEVFSVF